MAWLLRKENSIDYPHAVDYPYSIIQLSLVDLIYGRCEISKV